MSRNYFIISIVFLLVSGMILIQYQVRGYGFIVLLAGSLIAIFRRAFLKMKPWWGGKLTDIPKYFKEP